MCGTPPPQVSYPATLVRVIDGDTQVYDLDLGFGVYTRRYIRLYGVNTPELRGSEKPLGTKATLAAQSWLKGGVLSFSPILKGKYGREVGYVCRPDKGCLNDWLVKQGHAEEKCY